MRDLSFREILAKQTEQRETFALFVYSPLCGTCRAAERMLQVVSALLPDVPLYKANLNRMPPLAQVWRIESVPCVAIVRAGQVVDKAYAMRSIDHLYRLLQPLAVCTTAPAAPFANPEKGEKTMSECRIDHSFEDVRKKLDEQSPHLPNELVPALAGALRPDTPQEALNELFHLLKKYDLADEEERRKRNQQIRAWLVRQ